MIGRQEVVNPLTFEDIGPTSQVLSETLLGFANNP